MPFSRHLSPRPARSHRTDTPSARSGSRPHLSLERQKVWAGAVTSTRVEIGKTARDRDRPDRSSEAPCRNHASVPAIPGRYLGYTGPVYPRHTTGLRWVRTWPNRLGLLSVQRRGCRCRVELSLSTTPTGASGSGATSGTTYPCSVALATNLSHAEDDVALRAQPRVDELVD